MGTWGCSVLPLASLFLVGSFYGKVKKNSNRPNYVKHIMFLPTYYLLTYLSKVFIKMVLVELKVKCSLEDLKSLHFLPLSFWVCGGNTDKGNLRT